MKENKLMCPLGDELKVSKGVIKFLMEHHYIDIIKDGEYQFTLMRVERDAEKHEMEAEKHERSNLRI